MPSRTFGRLARSKLHVVIAIAPTLVLAVLAQQPPAWKIFQRPPGSYVVDTTGSPRNGDAR
ncbi:MAG TPA: hypothetical protein VGJ18_10135 [Gemmatimonadaceae bacterium]|jgi:hypothetical protein